MPDIHPSSVDRLGLVLAQELQHVLATTLLSDMGA